MKSKKIIAMVVAFAAFMAVATSGLAQVATTTTYNSINDKVVVSVDVTGATSGSEVTYLVKSNDQIVYIDQATASADGAVEFDYKIAKNKIVDLTTDVVFGTNGAAISGDDKAIELANVTTNASNATVEYFKDAECSESLGANPIVGDGDEIYAQVTVADGYQLESVTIGGVAVDDITATSFKVVGNKEVVVTTTETEEEAGVEVPGDIVLDAPELSEGTKAITKILRIKGSVSQVGVEYNGERYAAYRVNAKDEDDFFTDSGELCAVRLILPEAEAEDAVLTPYFEE